MTEQARAITPSPDASVHVSRQARRAATAGGIGSVVEWYDYGLSGIASARTSARVLRLIDKADRVSADLRDLRNGKAASWRPTVQPARLVPVLDGSTPLS